MDLTEPNPPLQTNVLPLNVPHSSACQGVCHTFNMAFGSFPSCRRHHALYRYQATERNNSEVHQVGSTEGAAQRRRMPSLSPCLCPSPAVWVLPPPISQPSSGMLTQLQPPSPRSSRLASLAVHDLLLHHPSISAQGWTTGCPQGVGALVPRTPPRDEASSLRHVFGHVSDHVSW